MTTRRIDDPLARALAVGPETMPDHLLSAIMVDVLRTPQRRGWLASHVSRELRIALLAAAVASVTVVLAITVVGRPSSEIRVVPPSPSPSGSPSPSPRSPTPTLAVVEGGDGITEVQTGQTVVVPAFSTPISFVMPEFPHWLGHPNTTTLLNEDHVLFLGAARYGLGIGDGAAVGADPCDGAAGLIPDVAPSPAAVARWLKASEHLAITGSGHLTVAGQTASWWDVLTDRGCDGYRDGTWVWFEEREHHRVYAIPAGGRNLLGITTAISTSFDTLDRAADELLQSLSLR
jgi:hypothetical protein